MGKTMALFLTLVQFAKLRKKRICRSKKSTFYSAFYQQWVLISFFDFDSQKDIKK
jgi:hypothetical protein